MNDKLTVIKMRWWGHLGMTLIVAVFGTLAAVADREYSNCECYECCGCSDAGERARAG
jgi:hypothetical protein